MSTEPLGTISLMTPGLLGGGADHEGRAIKRDLDGAVFVGSKDSRADPLIPPQNLRVRDPIDVAAAGSNDDDLGPAAVNEEG